MSGLTGYLVENGIDLSYVFMPIGSSIQLSANNTFTGKNTFSGGIVGPSASLTYTSDMIGYSIKTQGNGANVSLVSNTYATITDVSFAFPAVGVWMVSFYVFTTTNATSGYILYMNVGLGTTSAAGPTGQGSFEITVLATSNTPTFAGYTTGTGSYISTITSTSTRYYINCICGFSTVSITLGKASSYYQLTRIA
jgi:hypothetical protein